VQCSHAWCSVVVAAAASAVSRRSRVHVSLEAAVEQQPVQQEVPLLSVLIVLAAIIAGVGYTNPAAVCVRTAMYVRVHASL
jgi:hypothetical protein